MKIIVNDANILIDLVELKLLPHFFKLKFQFHTTSLILYELFEEQQEYLMPYIDNKKLVVEEMSASDLVKIKKLEKQSPSLSQQDCSAYYQAIRNEGTLITSDNSLRKFAKKKELDVHGHLWIFDCMVDAKTISPVRASVKLKELCEKINPRLKLPETECERRHKKWNR